MKDELSLLPKDEYLVRSISIEQCSIGTMNTPYRSEVQSMQQIKT